MLLVINCNGIILKQNIIILSLLDSRHEKCQQKKENTYSIMILLCIHNPKKCKDTWLNSGYVSHVSVRAKFMACLQFLIKSGVASSSSILNMLKKKKKILKMHHNRSLGRQFYSIVFQEINKYRKHIGWNKAFCLKRYKITIFKRGLDKTIAQ